MDELTQRTAVVTEARRWIGTPYHHQADVLGAGVDCGMLLVRVYVDTGIVPPFDPRPYPVQWHLHRDDERYLGFLVARGSEVEAPQSGDIVVWKIGRAFAHGGVVTGWPLVVHAYQPEAMVVESDISLPGPLSENRHRRFFDPWGGARHEPSDWRVERPGASTEGRSEDSQASGGERPATEGQEQP